LSCALLSFLCPVEPSDQSDVLGARLARHWAVSRNKAHAKSTSKDKPVHPSLFVALAKSYGGPYAMAAFFKLCNDLLSFSQPQLLRLLLKFVASYRTETPDPVS
jgi:ATP-binding cassette subfamily C (CFTR/MRP) protein 1